MQIQPGGPDTINARVSQQSSADEVSDVPQTRSASSGSIRALIRGREGVCA